MRTFKAFLFGSIIFTIVFAIQMSTRTPQRTSETLDRPPIARIGTVAPSLQQVRDVVRDYFERGEVGAQAKDSVKTWSEAAVPHLRTLAEEGLDSGLHFAWLCCVSGMDSPSNVELFVDVLNEETAVAGSRAIGSAHTLPNNPYWKPRLQEHEDFKPAALAFAQDESWLVRGFVARLAASMDWKDAIPLIEVMLEDDNQSLRETAAGALTVLTGERVLARTAPTSFPSRGLVAGLVGKPETMRVIGGGMTSLVSDFDGSPRLCMFDDTELLLRGLSGENRLPTRRAGAEAFSLPADGAAPALLVVAIGATSHRGEELIAINSAGEHVWTYPCKPRIDCVTTMQTLEGASCVVVRADQRLTVLSRNGELLWEGEGSLATRSLLAHPAFPGELYELHRRLNRSRVSETAVVPMGSAIKTEIHSSRGVLFPDAQGAPAFLIGGTADNSTPSVVRTDATGESLWSATLKGRIYGISMIESPGNPRLFVIADRSGMLTVLDEHGTLLAEMEIPHPTEDRDKFLYDFEAGELAPGEWGIYVKLVGDAFVFPLNLDALN